MSYEPRCCGQDGWQEINSVIDEFHSLRRKYPSASLLYCATTVCVETLNLKFCGWWHFLERIHLTRELKVLSILNLLEGVRCHNEVEVRRNMWTTLHSTSTVLTCRVVLVVLL